jgi:hypothetical protein
MIAARVNTYPVDVIRSVLSGQLDFASADYLTERADAGQGDDIGPSIPHLAETKSENESKTPKKGMYQIVRIRRNERHVCCRVQKNEVLNFDFDFPSWDLEICEFHALELRNMTPTGRLADSGLNATVPSMTTVDSTGTSKRVEFPLRTTSWVVPDESLRGKKDTTCPLLCDDGSQVYVHSTRDECGESPSRQKPARENNARTSISGSQKPTGVCWLRIRC